MKLKVKNYLVIGAVLIILISISVIVGSYIGDKIYKDNTSQKEYVTEPLIINTYEDARMRHPYEAEINIIGSENTEPIVFEGLIVEIAMKEDGTLKIVSTDSIRKYYSNKDIEREWFDE